MNNTTGNYYRMTSMDGFDNLGLKVKFDIIIIFDSSFTISSEISDSLDLMLEGGLRGIALNNPYAKKREVLQRVYDVLKLLGYTDYVCNVFIDQSIHNFELSNSELIPA